VYDLRWFMSVLEQNGELLRIRKSVSPKYEVPAIIKKKDREEALFFENVKGYSMPIIAGVANSREKICKALGVSMNELYSRLLTTLNKLTKPKIKQDAPVLEEEDKDLSTLPILTHYEKDKAPYITAGVVYAKDPESKYQNASIHRLMVIDNNHLGIRIVPRHLYSIYKKAKKKHKPVEVAIAIGLNPLICLAASAPLPFGVDEMYLANSLMNEHLEMVKCNNVDLLVPADSEIVIEGQIQPDKQIDEGPFVDITGTYDVVRQEPVIEVLNVMHRKNPIYQALLPAGAEHRLLMGLFREVKIWEHTKNVVPYVRGVNLTISGCGWLHAVVSVKKQTEGDGKNVIFAVFSGHPSVKHVVVVDEDIDPYNLEDVEWAIATRVRGDKDIIVVPNARGSSLDPSGDQVNALTAKVGVDATRTFTKPKEDFEKAKIPGEENINIDDYLN